MLLFGLFVCVDLVFLSFFVSECVDFVGDLLWIFFGFGVLMWNYVCIDSLCSIDGLILCDVDVECVLGDFVEMLDGGVVCVLMLSFASRVSRGKVSRAFVSVGDYFIECVNWWLKFVVVIVLVLVFVVLIGMLFWVWIKGWVDDANRRASSRLIISRVRRVVCDF